MAQHRDYDREVTVYVWRFLSLAHFGHAAVKITGVRTIRADDAKAYISWWPKGGATIFGAFKQRGASPTETYKDDMHNEISDRAQRQLQRGPNNGGYAPRPNQVVVGQNSTGDNVFGIKADEVIKLPAFGATGVAWGLDTSRINDWWNVFRHTPHPHYKLASKHTNCAGVAAMALSAGGGEAYADPPSPTLFMNPNQVAAWATSIKARLDILNTTAGQVAQNVVTPEPRAGVSDVMTYAEWKELSNRNMGAAWMRSAGVRKLDSLLKDYHGLGWADAERKKLKLLAGMLDAVHEYLGHKLNSKRGDAVLTLGAQALWVLKRRFSTARTRIERPEKFEWVRK